MLIHTIFVRELKGTARAAGIIIAFLTCCSAAITGMFSPETARMLAELKTQMPELYNAFGMGNDTSTLTGFLLNYLYGFLFTLGPLALTLLIVNRSIVRPIANGELINILASPHPRRSIATSIALATIVSILSTAMLCALATVIAAEILFPGKLDLAAMARVNLGLAALQLFMAGLCLLSAFALRRSQAALWAGGCFCLAEYLIQMVLDIAGAQNCGRFATFFSLFDPYTLAAGSPDAIKGAACLAIAGAICFIGAVHAFSQRDLYL